MWKALAVLLGLSSPPGDAAIGDSIALGTGSALGVPTYARSSMSSCWVLRHLPNQSFDRVVISAGINDAPGRCVDDILSRVQARHVVVILPAPINSARAHVAAVAAAHGAQTLAYACHGGCTRSNFHPGSYAVVAQDVRRLWNVVGNGGRSGR